MTTRAEVVADGAEWPKETMHVLGWFEALEHPFALTGGQVRILSPVVQTLAPSMLGVGQSGGLHMPHVHAHRGAIPFPNSAVVRALTVPRSRSRFGSPPTDADATSPGSHCAPIPPKRHRLLPNHVNPRGDQPNKSRGIRDEQNDGDDGEPSASPS